MKFSFSKVIFHENLICTQYVHVIQGLTEVYHRYQKILLITRYHAEWLAHRSQPAILRCSHDIMYRIHYSDTKCHKLVSFFDATCIRISLIDSSEFSQIHRIERDGVLLD